MLRQPKCWCAMKATSDRVGQLWVARKRADEPFHECLIIRRYTWDNLNVKEVAWVFRPLHDLANDAREATHYEEQFHGVEAGHFQDNWIRERIA